VGVNLSKNLVCSQPCHASCTMCINSAKIALHITIPAGVKAAGRAAFVLVAGGLGERLGYSGIKLALPVESASNKCFLQVDLHCSGLLACC